MFSEASVCSQGAAYYRDLPTSVGGTAYIGRGVCLVEAPPLVTSSGGHSSSWYSSYSNAFLF